MEEKIKQLPEFIQEEIIKKQKLLSDIQEILENKSLDEDLVTKYEDDLYKISMDILTDIYINDKTILNEDELSIAENYCKNGDFDFEVF